MLTSVDRGAAVQARYEVFKREFYTNGENATQAAIAAGYSPRTAHVQGAQLLQRLNIQRAASVQGQRLLEKSGLTEERVLRFLEKSLFSDPRRLYNPDGTLKNIHELDDDTALAVQSLDVDQFYTGRGSKRSVAGATTKVRMMDKVALLDRAMRHMGLFERDNRQRQANMALQVVVGVGAATERREPDDP